MRNGARPPVLLELSGPTVDVSGFSFNRLQRVTDAIDVLSHDSNDIFTAFNQLWHLQGKSSSRLTDVMKPCWFCSRFSGPTLQVVLVQEEVTGIHRSLLVSLFSII